MARNGGLTPRQKAFVEEYVRDYNKTQAYKRACKSPDMPDDTAYKGAYRILKTDEAINYMHELQDEILRQSGLNATYILNGLREIYEDPTSTKAEKIKAADLMSKNLGLQTQKIELDKAIEIKVGIENGDKANS